MSNERGHYGPRPRIGADAPSGRSNVPWLLGGAGLVVVGLTVFGAYAKRPRPRLSPHEKEVHAWETEFPGLPWYMDQVKDARQLDMWERARDHWERTR
jgi:hypothetical protein